MNRLLVRLVVMASILLSAFGVLGAKSTSIPCDGPATTTIKVLVEHTEGSSVYKYTVINNHSHEITFLFLSDDIFMWSSFNQENISFNLKALQGMDRRISLIALIMAIQV